MTIRRETFYSVNSFTTHNSRIGGKPHTSLFFYISANQHSHANYTVLNASFVPKYAYNVTFLFHYA
jgi:hypothetical protein